MAPGLLTGIIPSSSNYLFRTWTDCRIHRDYRSFARSVQSPGGEEPPRLQAVEQFAVCLMPCAAETNGVGPLQAGRRRYPPEEEAKRQEGARKRICQTQVNLYGAHSSKCGRAGEPVAAYLASAAIPLGAA